MTWIIIQTVFITVLTMLCIYCFGIEWRKGRQTYQDVTWRHKFRRDIAKRFRKDLGRAPELLSSGGLESRVLRYRTPGAEGKLESCHDEALRLQQ